MWGEGSPHCLVGLASYQGSEWMNSTTREVCLGEAALPRILLSTGWGWGMDCQGFQVFCSLRGPLINIHKRLCVFKMWRSGLPPASVGRGLGTAHVEWPFQLLWPEFLSHIKGGNWLEKSGREPELKTAEGSKFSASSPEETRGGLSRLFP